MILPVTPSRGKVRRQGNASVLEQLESVLFEREAPKKFLMDNATSFHSDMLYAFAQCWGTVVKYRCANVPSGNGIFKWCHRTVKTILTRKGCSVAEAVYRYNTMPKGSDANSAPASQIFRYAVRLLDIDEVNEEHLSAVRQNRSDVGDRAWIRHAVT